MAAFESQLTGREEVAEGTMAFHFSKPAGFDFKAGQSMTVALVDPPETDAKGNRRNFSIVSAPFEGELAIATRMRDTAFKRVLKTVPMGTKVHLRGPGGKLVLDGNDSRPAVLLAGGIGITPFVSMLRQAARDRLPHKLFLFYSNRRPEDAAFLDELIELQRRNPNYRFVGTMTEMEKSRRPWQGALYGRAAGDDRGDAEDARRGRGRERKHPQRRVLRLLKGLAADLRISWRQPEIPGS